ncbi:MAG TPA: primase-helicase family protein [Abditibacteriaceae bacterium]
MSDDEQREDVDEFDPHARAAELERQIDEIRISQPATLRHEDFIYVGSEDLFRHVESLTPFPAAGVDACVQPWREIDMGVDAQGNPRPPRRVKPSVDIKADPAKVVHGVTWYPVADKIIENMAITSSGDIRNIPNYRILNLYVPPKPHAGCPEQAAPWLDLGRRLIPDPIIRHRIEQIFAFKLRYPHIKVNCGILIGGHRRVGKDMWIDAFIKALGRGNSSTIDPDEIFEPFNPYAQCVALKINEMEPNGSEHKAWSLIKKLKPYCAAPPDALFIKEKNVKRYGIPNVLLVIGMTNALKTIYMEEDRGRWMVIDCYHLPMLWYMQEDPDYFIKYKAWLDGGGEQHVAAYLETVDLSDFNPGNPVVVTEALEQLIDYANSAPDDTFEKILDSTGNPQCLFTPEFYDHIDPGDKKATEELDSLFRSRSLIYRAEKSGYRVVQKERTEAQKANKEKPRFQFTLPNGSKLKATSVLVKNSVSKEDEGELILLRGREWVANRAGRGVTPTGSGGPTVGTGEKVVSIRPEKF